jgi:hypothetical protein
LVQARGGLTYKFIGLEAGVPDRIVITPNGSVWFVELKTEEGRLSKIQGWQINRLIKVNANVRVLYGRGSVDNFIREVFENGV